MELYVAPDGTVRAVHSDDLDLTAIGHVEVRRASHVEPGPGGWWVDLAPVGGPRFGPFPINRRQVALDAEAAWLRAAMAEGRDLSPAPESPR